MAFQAQSRAEADAGWLRINSFTLARVVILQNLLSRQHARVDGHLIEGARQEPLHGAFQRTSAETHGGGSVDRSDLPFRVVVERAGRGRPQAVLAVLVNVDSRPAACVRVAGIV